MILDTKNMSPQMPIGYLPHPQPLQHDEEPVSRTYQYRKVMKPMLERKRRARINRCLDELKELMVTALQAEGENVSKLEKADILELTVRHLHGLKRRGQLVAKPEMSYAERFRAGFTHCATEVSQFITNATLAATAMQRQGPVDPQAGARLLQHLSSCIRRLDNPYVQQPQAIAPSTESPQTQDKNQLLAQTSPNINSPVGNQLKYQENRGTKRPADSRPDGSHAKQCYAPPSPPHSPALSTESLEAQSQSMWRPW